MKVSELIREMGCTAAFDGWNDRSITGGFTSDLLSDVMANAEENQVLITIQSHKNTVAVAALKDLAAIVIASGRSVPEDVIEAARDEDLPILVTSDNQFRCSWKVHKLLHSEK